jgi:hypothetical protein
MAIRRMAALGAVLAAALALGLGGWRAYEWREEARQLVFVVPAGTSARMAAGEDPQVLPRLVELRIGGQDTLVIRNDDSAPVQVGPYRVEPGQRLVQRYRSAGTFDMVCSLHRGEALRVVVTR